MKAAVLYGFGQPLVIEDVELDPPGPGEVKVRIGAAAICHSDIHDFKGEHGISTFPAIGGHEAAGYVEEIGKGITYVKPGDHVVVTHEKGVGQWAGWRYYLSANKYGSMQIEIADNNIEGLDELIDAVFDMAINASFVKIENISSIPFIKKIKISQWNRT